MTLILGEVLRGVTVSVDSAVHTLDQFLSQQMQWLEFQTSESSPPSLRSILFDSDEESEEEKCCERVQTIERKGPSTRSLPVPREFIQQKTEPFLDRIVRGNEFLNHIISSLSDTNIYEMSDWEDDDAMKTSEIDIEADEYAGSKIPEWARGEMLYRSFAMQNPSDGERLFADLPRRCDLYELFGTRNFRYYAKKALQSSIC